jgi:uncharacterized protein (DUF342 family)
VSNGITVMRSPDGIKGFVTVLSQREHSYPTCQELLDAIGAAGIVFGINNQAMIDMASTKTVNKRVEIAQGIPPEPGIAGRIEMLVDVHAMGKPRVLSNDSVDFHDISYVINVRKGDRLARRIQPVLGKEGKTVQGKPIIPPLPADVHLPMGSGTIVSASDPDLLLAKHDGGICIDRNGTIEVHKEEQIPGDVDYRTGDVKFTGDLSVSGSLRAGFSIESKGNLTIGGTVEDATIRCNGSIMIKRGAVGAGNGSATCDGTFAARHLENFRVIAGGDVVISEDVVNASIDASGVVYAKTVRGGCIRSERGVEAVEIGAQGEVKTIVDIGKKYERIQTRYKMLSKLASLTTELEKNRELIFHYVRDNMNESGTLSGENETMLSAMKLKIEDLVRTHSATHDEIERLDAQKSEIENPYIKALKIHPNTIVKFGVGEQIIRETLERVRLSPLENGAAVTLAQETIAYPEER